MIDSGVNQVIYRGNGQTTSFTFNFKVLEAKNVRLIRVDVNGIETEVVSDYYVDMEASKVYYPGYAPGAEEPNNQRPPVLADGEKLVIYRDVPITQEVDLPENYPFNLIEDMADKGTIIDQQLMGTLERSLKINRSSYADDFDGTIPVVAGKTFRFSDDGKKLEATEDPGKVIDVAQGLLAETQANAVIAQNAANVAVDAKDTVLEAAPEYIKVKQDLDAINLSKAEAKASADISASKAVEANQSADLAKDTALSVLETLRATNLIANSGNADQLSTANATDIINLKEDISKLKLKSQTYGDFVKKVVEGKSVILAEKDVRGVSLSFTEQKVDICGKNRFNLSDAEFTFSGYSSTNTLTKLQNGIELESRMTSITSSVFVTTPYVAEFSGTLHFSCYAHTDGDVRDIRTLLIRDGVTLETEYGEGRHIYCVDVNIGDVVTFGFQSHNQTPKPNRVVYDNIMVSYGGLYDFVPYKESATNREYIKRTLSNTEIASWTAKSAATVAGGDLYRVEYPNNILGDMLAFPANNDTLADVTVVGELPLITANQTFNNINGISITSVGKIFVYNNGMGRTAMQAWLAEHPLSLVYKTKDYTTVTVDVDFAQGDIINFENTPQTVEYWYRPDTTAKEIGICFGDSITGMFGHGADYPSIISRKSKYQMTNVGFAGCRWTDHSSTIYRPFSMNRLVDSIISRDFSFQDASPKVTVGNSNYDERFAEHLKNLKEFDFKKATLCTIYYGVNDWQSSVCLKSSEDPSIENKQRTNVEDAINYCIDKLLTNFPNLRIVIITPYWWGATGEHNDSNVDANIRGDYLKDYGAYMRKVAEDNFNVPTINLYNCGASKYTNSYFTRDAGHPTLLMKNIIADKIIKSVCIK